MPSKPKIQKQIVGQTTVSTLFLRITRVDWPRILAGEKTEYRAHGPDALPMAALKPPIPVVGYARPEVGEPVGRLLVIEEARMEPLGAIGPESIEAEGFESLAEFRSYWRRYRTRQRYRPLDKVNVYQLRVFRPGDVEFFGRRFLELLYGALVP